MGGELKILNIFGGDSATLLKTKTLRILKSWSFRKLHNF